MSIHLQRTRRGAVEIMASATLSIETRGRGFVEITREIDRFIRDTGAQDGVLLAYLRHTSASLVIQENADPEVRADLALALDRLAPEGAGWIHDSEGADDMPAHIKTMLTATSLHVPVIAGTLGLGTWQGIFLAEHRSRPHAREIILQFIGSENTRA